MRLAGVGMIGVVHATKPIDAIQRFIGRIELGVIPQVVDTVIFIKDGRVNKVFNIKMSVKVPSGMVEADLARPIVTVNDFETGKLEYEVYSYGEETVVVPVKAEMSSPLQGLAAESIRKEFMRYSDLVKVDVVSDNNAIIYVPESSIAQIIGKGGQNIEFIEKKLRMHFDIQPLTSAKQGTKSNTVEFEAQIGKDNIIFFLQEKDKNKDIDIIVNGDYLLTAKSSKKAIIKIKKDNKIGRILVNSLNAGEEMKLVC
jgi:ATPase